MDSASCSWVIGPHQLVGAHAPQIGGASGVASMRRDRERRKLPPPGLYLIDNDFISWGAVALTTKSMQISTHCHKLVFVLRKCFDAVLQQCKIQTIFRRQYLQTPEGGREERGICFCSPKCTETLLQRCICNNFSGDYTPDPVLGEKKSVFLLQKCFKTLLQQCRIVKYFRI